MENDISFNLNLEFEPTVFFRCHSANIDDYRTRIWQAVFEPEPSNIIATVGGNRICLIDVERCKVRHRYTAETNTEEFYTLTWNTRILDGEQRNVLIAGGKSNKLYFIYPRLAPKNVLLGQYAIPRKNKHSAIYSLAIHPQQSDVIFCAVHNDGIYAFRSSLSVKLDPEVELVTKLTVLPDVMRIVIGYDFIFAATSNGLFTWNLKDVMDKSAPLAKSITIVTNENQKDSASEIENYVDSIDLLGDNLIATKYAEKGVIYIWDLNRLTKQDEDSLKVVCSFILNWSSTDEYHIELASNGDLGILSCGDDDGTIWLYDLHHLKNRNSLDVPIIVEPANLIIWPVIEDKVHAKAKKLNMNNIIINKAVISRNGNNLVAITDKNMVCLWRKCPKMQH